MFTLPALRRLLAAALVLLAALPGAGAAQSITYRFDGAVDFLGTGAPTAVGFTLTGDLANVVDDPPASPYPGVVSGPLAGSVYGSDGSQSVSGWVAARFDVLGSPIFDGLFVGTEFGQLLSFRFTEAFFLSYDLRSAVAPRQTTFAVLGIAEAVGTGTFQATVDGGGEPPPVATVPEPSTWAMLAGGLALLGAVRGRRARGGREVR
ncbi:PEP-CTERM sorting domain-containing protein [Roseisolibacter sp. H3M3-2]|uniref:PEP-CTERM sorting domain-containing protein n=1 Tax=Roseisolibacter sp. H3M3-2 TaxID=3031323 RepID=UPI0023DC7705|nr:PEP-CTERM sorting domain-containing protein [Roseisolibacter sp. H3M3-2]MDF1504100.1 PEP-CTERM sorting domain-containing protein [Roseisolibacter sp. H3M3-2]